MIFYNQIQSLALLPIPLCTFLFCIALQGRLNLVCYHQRDDIKQPLINKFPPPNWVSSNDYINMEQNPQHGNSNINQLTQYSRDSVWSLMTFCWLNPLFVVGYKKTLEPNDVPNVAGKDTAKYSYRVLQTN